MATNTTKAGLWDLEREDYNDDQNSEKASDNGCADHEYNENDYENDILASSPTENDLKMIMRMTMRAVRPSAVSQRLHWGDP